MKGLKFSLLAAIHLWTAVCVLSTYIRRWSYLTVNKGAMHSHLYRMKWCELLECKWNADMTITVESRFKQYCQMARKKVFQGFNGSQTRGLCVCAAVLYQLNDEDPYTGSRPIYWDINPWKEWNTEWNDVICRNTNEVKIWPLQWSARIHWCDLQEYKWSEDMTIAAIYGQHQNLLRMKISKIF